MRTPRVRFSIRALMAAVAIAAIVGGIAVTLDRRAKAARKAMGYHYTRLSNFSPHGRAAFLNSPEGEIQERKRKQMFGYHSRLFVKYQEAARRPWLPIEPDPPVPE